MLARNDPNLSRIERTFAEIVSLTDELTIVGGCAAGLLITDPAAPAVRPTFDVDLVVESASYVEYSKLGVRLNALGFLQGTVHGDPICRWRKEDLVLDVMPLDESVLGFSSRWYRSAIGRRQTCRLPGGPLVHHIDAPHFLATKLAAFESRGGGDFLGSHDLEDLIRVVDGRPGLVEELQSAPAELRSFVSMGLSSITTDRFFQEAMPEYFGSGTTAVDRARIVSGRLQKMIAV